MKMPTRTIALLFSLIVSYTANSQKIEIKNFSIGYRVFEISPVGNNPITIVPLLKDPVAYQNFLRTINYNNLYGNPGIQQLHTFYISTELQVDSPVSRFWKKHTLQTGIHFTAPLVQSAGALADQHYTYLPDTVLHDNQYSLVKNQQFFGAQAGINRRFNISKKLKAVAGLQVQGSVAIVHYYQQQWDSSTYSSNQGLKTHVSSLPNLNGKNFFQWQAMIPLGFEYPIYQRKLFLRLEFCIGIIGGRYRPKDFSANEAHGAGISIIFQPKKRNS